MENMHSRIGYLSGLGIYQDWVFIRIRYLKCTCNGTGNGELYGTHVSLSLIHI